MRDQERECRITDEDILKNINLSSIPSIAARNAVIQIRGSYAKIEAAYSERAELFRENQDTSEKPKETAFIKRRKETLDKTIHAILQEIGHLKNQTCVRKFLKEEREGYISKREDPKNPIPAEEKRYPEEFERKIDNIRSERLRNPSVYGMDEGHSSGYSEESRDPPASQHSSGSRKKKPQKSNFGIFLIASVIWSFLSTALEFGSSVRLGVIPYLIGFWGIYWAISSISKAMRDEDEDTPGGTAAEQVFVEAANTLPSAEASEPNAEAAKTIPVAETGPKAEEHAVSVPKEPPLEPPSSHIQSPKPSRPFPAGKVFAASSAILLCLLAVTFVLGKQAESRAKESGYQEGYDLGLETGLQEGHDSGYEEGYAACGSENHETIQTEAYNDGWSDAYTQARAQEYEKGYLDGYNLGVADTNKDGELSKEEITAELQYIAEYGVIPRPAGY